MSVTSLNLQNLKQIDYTEPEETRKLSLQKATGAAGQSPGSILQPDAQTNEDARKSIAAVAAQAAQNSPAYARTPSGNSMQGNFVRNDHEQSKYIKTTLSDKQSDKSFANKLGSLVGAMTSEMSYEIAARTARSPGAGGAIGAGVMYAKGLSSRRRVADVVEEEVSERAKEHLKKSRDDMEEKTAEAMAPSDAAGNPIAVPGADLPESVLPEQNGASQSPEPDIARQQANAAAQAATTAQVARPAAPLPGAGVTKLDITV